MRALIDGDIIVHRVAHTTGGLAEPLVRHRADELLDRILLQTSSESFEIFLSDVTENGFRIKYYPSYKANRDQSKPEHYDFLKEHLIVNWGARIALGQEADDALGIEQRSTLLDSRNQSCICTVDKDLNQIPGLHFNFVKGLIYEVDERTAIKYFYEQLITGDRGDNVPGVHRIGPMRADAILRGCETEADMFYATVSTYVEYLQKEWKSNNFSDFEHNQMLNLILMYGIALKIRQEEEEIWTFPANTIEPPVLPVFQSVSMH